MSTDQQTSLQELVKRVVRQGAELEPTGPGEEPGIEPSHLIVQVKQHTDASELEIRHVMEELLDAGELRISGDLKLVPAS